MFDTKVNLRCNKIFLYCLEIYTVLVLILIYKCYAIPVQQKYFPEQKLPPPSQLKDGQSFSDKVFIMKMMNSLEKQTMRRYGVKQWIPFLREYVYEGDIILRRDQALDIVTRHRSRKKRKMDAEVTSDNASKKWPLPINYIFDNSHTKEQEAEIKEGIRHWADQTCITFTNNQTSDIKSIRFIDNYGCYSYVGYINDNKHQNISVGVSCTKKGIVAHEIGHALGFWHEHAREDRDMYLDIIWNNIILGQYHNFEKKSWEIIDNLAVIYDLSSVMHYSGHQFAKGSVETIKAKNPLLQHSMGQRQALSFYDVKLANLAYCHDTCSPSELTGTCLHDGYQDPKNCSRCRCPDGLGGDFCETVAPSNYDCGGIVELTPDTTPTISSPSYPAKYAPGLNCYWLIKSPTGTAINVKFKEPLMHSEKCDASQPYLPCEDFVEVRFTDNLGITGGRFCCSDSVQIELLSHPIVTHSNHALLLFKTFYGVTTGFQLTVSIESCGGCHNTVTDLQAPCKRTVRKECKQTWQKVVRVSCTLGSFWCQTKYELKTMERTTECVTEEDYCCDGYTLSDDSTMCSKSSSMEDSTSNEATSADTNSDTTELAADQGNTNKWSSWSGWSDCSVACGGCGEQLRSRQCPNEGVCRGDHTQTKTCGFDACNFGNAMQTCFKSEKRSYTCGLGLFGGTPSTCYRMLTSYYTQTMNCCCGYKIQDGICVKDYNAR